MIMNEWCRQIKTHLVDDIQVLKYHGKRRERLTAKFHSSHIVLTTYHTLAADRKLRRSHVRRIAWFRIVLDEAHTIRQQQTTLFAAVSELDSPRRWCLTGTPIQNRLDDLGSLLTFIRAEPFDKSLMFHKCIVMPFLDNVRDGSERLSLLLNSFCLRRTSRHLQLPPLRENVHIVEFTAKEQKLYDDTLTLMDFAGSHGSREKRQKLMKTPYGRFQIQLQLRLICNHGSFLKRFSWDDLDLESQTEDIIQVMGAGGEISCSRCHQHTLVSATNCSTKSHLQLQSPVLCNDCEESEDSQADGLLSPSSTPDISQVLSSATSTGGRAKAKFVSSGFSSKIGLLLKHVM